MECKDRRYSCAYGILIQVDYESDFKDNVIRCQCFNTGWMQGEYTDAESWH